MLQADSMRQREKKHKAQSKTFTSSHTMRDKNKLCSYERDRTREKGRNREHVMGGYWKRVSLPQEVKHYKDNGTNKCL